MTCTSRFLFASAAVCLLAAAPSANAAVITATDAAWPTGGVQTVDANNNSPGARGVNTARINRQSFVVGSAITVEKIYLSSNGYENQPLTVGVYAIADPLDGASIADETSPIGALINVPALGASGGAGNIEILLDASEQFSLSPGAYALSVQGADPAGGTAFLWNHSNDGTDLYTAGMYRRDDGSTSSTRDFGLALTGAVPEPASLLLTLLGVVGVGTRRGRG
ncbi:hypothetical protein Pla123a_45910 [Posidoniimonas polymericola]|uniref:PEP-CTERM protein-sorting domain-containing protein n=1 Tax=Posidoniimonas polymericola TaxID=2528002 RepID=A0A5C5XVH4_9BACT|nr:PEP-CTERM sorting domain-containing protein [Posidoniimonas polymericola]TWT66890.1 hypothetical protein Pla123a_45910 [Posidoniimonas polymericola]